MSLYDEFKEKFVKISEWQYPGATTTSERSIAEALCELIEEKLNQVKPDLFIPGEPEIREGSTSLFDKFAEMYNELSGKTFFSMSSPHDIFMMRALCSIIEAQPKSVQPEPETNSGVSREQLVTALNEALKMNNSYASVLERYESLPRLKFSSLELFIAYLKITGKI